jgi:hypothetical protein
MTMIRDKNGDDSVSVSTYSIANAKKNPRQNRPRLLRGKVTEDSTVNTEYIFLLEMKQS